MKTITTPNHDHRITKIIAEIRGTCIEGVDIEVIEDILLRELTEYHNEVFTYGYDIGYDGGYDEGYDIGYDEGHSGVKTLIKVR